LEPTLEQLSFAVVEDMDSSYNEDDENRPATWLSKQGDPRRKQRYALWELQASLPPSPSAGYRFRILKADNLGLTSKPHLTLLIEWYIA
jgi:hypothetical protein